MRTHLYNIIYIYIDDAGVVQWLNFDDVYIFILVYVIGERRAEKSDMERGEGDFSSKKRPEVC